MSVEKAAVDHIDEGIAVLLVGDEEREMLVPLGRLPAGLQAGDWLKVTIIDGQLRKADLGIEETKRRRERIRSKLDKLF
ncbi:MAG: DUF3006 domain-containing protein [Chloroflexi bacterium]|nr:DUF3006 domain-containing protein [Chloroflexota bacterium]